jgi:Fur family transcriptional regulator, peroxide stress response regulator
MEEREARIAELTQRLAERGYRLTPQRLAVVRALVDARNHPSAEDLFARVRETCPTTSLATVYKTLDTLKEIGEVLELEFREGSNRYDGIRPGAHPHLVCTRCGRIEDLDLEGLEALTAQVAQSTGYEIRSHRVDFYGICGECQ